MKAATILNLSPVKSCATLAVCAFILGVCPVIQAADYYRWQDQQGVVHYTDKPPKGVDAKKLATKTRQPKASEESETPADKVDQDASAKDAERCKAEQDRLAVLESNSKVQMRDAEGNLRTLNAQEMQTEIAFAQKAIQHFCK